MQGNISLGTIDFEKLFDRVNRTKMWKILIDFGKPDK